MIVTQRERERERGRDTGRGRSRLHAREPDVGFDPGSPGSRPGPKAGAKPLRHPGSLLLSFLIVKTVFMNFLPEALPKNPFMEMLISSFPRERSITFLSDASL